MSHISFTESLHPFSVGADTELLVGFKVGNYEAVWRTSKVCPHLLCCRSSLYLPDES
jgi:hypothetical protein